MSAPTHAQAECRWCGAQSLRPNDLRCAADPVGRAAGICEFPCPSCSRLVLIPTTASRARNLVTVGAAEPRGLARFEALEPHTGPLIPPDDYFDLCLSLAVTATPQQEISE